MMYKERLYPIVSTGLKASKLISQGKYDYMDSYYICNMADDLFPIKKHKETTKIIELIKFDSNLMIDLERIFNEFINRGLKRPSYEDALVFGFQHPNEQQKNMIVFLHKPVLISNHESIVVLYSYYLKRGISIPLLSSIWHGDCVFAAIRPQHRKES